MIVQKGRGGDSGWGGEGASANALAIPRLCACDRSLIPYCPFGTFYQGPHRRGFEACPRYRTRDSSHLHAGCSICHQS